MEHNEIGPIANTNYVNYYDNALGPDGVKIEIEIDENYKFNEFGANSYSLRQDDVQIKIENDELIREEAKIIKEGSYIIPLLNDNIEEHISPGCAASGTTAVIAIDKQDFTEREFVCQISQKSKVQRDSKKYTGTRIGRKVFICDLCDYKYYRKIGLIFHLSKHSSHTSEKPIACLMCDYKCSGNSDLKDHMSIHRGSKPFVCHICGYRCRQKGTLKDHRKRHTNEKRYDCSFCNQKYFQKTALKRHIRTHTGEKPFECYVCCCKFAVKKTLDRHFKTHRD